MIGALAFVFFFVTSIRVLINNLRYGDAEIKNINVFLISLFIGRLVLFVVLFGAIESDFWTFASCVGLSLSVNGGVKTATTREPRSIERNSGVASEVELATA